MIIDNYKNRFQFNNLRNLFFDNEHNFNYFISNVIISLANFLIIFFFIKFLSPELYADIIKLKISLFVLNIISTLGISQSYIFYKDTEYFNIERYNFYLLVLCLFSILLTVIVILLLRYSYEVKLNIYASTSLIFLNIFIILNNDLLNRLRADFNSHKYKILVLVRYLLLTFLLSLNISNNFQIEYYIYCYLSSEIFLSIFCGKEILKIKIDLIFFKKFLVQGIPFSLIALFSYLYQFLDRFIIEFYMGKLILAKYDVIFFFSYSFIVMFASIIHLYAYPKYISLNKKGLRREINLFLLSQKKAYYKYSIVFFFIIFIFQYYFFEKFTSYEADIFLSTFLCLSAFIFGLNILHFSNLYVDNKVYKIVFILILLNIFMVTFLIMSLNFIGIIGVPMSTLVINLLFLIYLKKVDTLNIISKYEIILAICCILLLILSI